VLKRAIVRPPSENFGEGLTTAQLGLPDYSRAVVQHDAYCAALEKCGLELVRLEADPRFPDSTFVEDTAVITEKSAILTRPGAPSRTDEVESIKPVLALYPMDIHEIQPPGTLDGGDVCEAGNHFLIGISARTNEAGGDQLAKVLSSYGYTSSVVDIRGVDSLLHLKSGLAYLGDDRLVVIEALANRPEFSDYNLVRVMSGEEYSANCVRINDLVLLAKGYSTLKRRLRELRYEMVELDMTEFQRMDGGLSCLSLRF